jgi:hypothetical protein
MALPPKPSPAEGEFRFEFGPEPWDECVTARAETLWTTSTGCGKSPEGPDCWGTKCRAPAQPELPVGQVRSIPEESAPPRALAQVNPKTIPERALRGDSAGAEEPRHPPHHAAPYIWISGSSSAPPLCIIDTEVGHWKWAKAHFFVGRVLPDT